jgi:hypothetical protein
VGLGGRPRRRAVAEQAVDEQAVDDLEVPQ